MSRTWPRSPPGLPRRAAHRLPQPGPGRRARPQARGPAGRDRGRPGQDRRPGRGRADQRPGQDRPGRREDHEQAEDRQALRPRHRRRAAHLAAQPGLHRRRSATDGIYVIRTPVPAETLDAPGAVAAYKALASLERDFRSIKADDLDLRPIFHRLDDRVRGHVLICTLACYLTWHLRKAWAPLTYADEHPTRSAPTPSPPHTAHRPPTPRPPARPDPANSPSAASATCWTTWPPSPATTCATAR